MSSNEKMWDNNHHYSSFLPKLEIIENSFNDLISLEIIEHHQNLISIYEIIPEKNLGNIEKTNPLDISVKSIVVENVQIGARLLFFGWD